MSYHAKLRTIAVYTQFLRTFEELKRLPLQVHKSSVPGSLLKSIDSRPPLNNAQSSCQGKRTMFTLFSMEAGRGGGGLGTGKNRLTNVFCSVTEIFSAIPDFENSQIVELTVEMMSLADRHFNLMIWYLDLLKSVIKRGDQNKYPSTCLFNLVVKWYSKNPKILEQPDNISSSLLKTQPKFKR
ncbi:hypothetical protein K438DRAFT_1788388 [Mycena galopus ATCC 62051]|nr:hypothetical protein K438DRAFT_1788388 [Mycena galopus ATCC 62051]